MSDLERVQKETHDNLVNLGYSENQAQTVANSLARISGYFRGKPSRVMTNEGIELWLF